VLRACLAWLAFVMPIAVLASEGRVTGTDVAEIRAVIHRQTDAFRRDDAHGAFALVSPGGQRAFGRPASRSWSSC